MAYPGEMQLTRMFLVAHSTASDEAICRTAAFELLQGLIAVSDRKPDQDD